MRVIKTKEKEVIEITAYTIEVSAKDMDQLTRIIGWNESIPRLLCSRPCDKEDREAMENWMGEFHAMLVEAKCSHA